MYDPAISLLVIFQRKEKYLTCMWLSRQVQNMFIEMFISATTETILRESINFCLSHGCIPYDKGHKKVMNVHNINYI